MKKSTLPKLRILLDANISYVVVSRLSEYFDFDVIHISQLSKESLSDGEIVEIAKKQKRIILTHDLDYGEIFFLSERGGLAVIMMRFDDQ